MFEIVFKIWFLIAIMPLTLAQEGYAKLKPYLEKKGIKIDWLYVTLFSLILLLIILLMLGFPFN